ncbi:HI0074 family nucleotidyltransferase substrate-binding subunit [Silanimonas sp.]|uniref:HI0074 family nucleotidyltransferase substrate-binding subunit n=1 Tax=Silanimonas sp. TaxID=1929290 RepID=UPI001BB95011|nr:HI0074 family nucleotidyltransferase substrate-binding subunit [Silanimonas sp.]MBS3895194.1 HI0074 family nucleotidyltransferase substrate-binding subunit [Silanimonas sp.]MBS3924919.1 HI0074 family nucleotidyltransferase substrate-binding subunit [Xanthomonadaceae bacterium]
MNMQRERFDLHRAQYVKALQRLHEALAVDETDIVRDALIQRFEFTFELAWKAMYDLLRLQGENPPKMVRPVLQAAFVARYIADAQAWERIKDYRDETSHTYDAAKAIEVAAFIRAEAVAAFDALAQVLAKH